MLSHVCVFVGQTDLKDNLGAAGVTITKEEHAHSRNLIEETKVVGDRYPDMSGVNA
jgi:hypothetical protein